MPVITLYYDDIEELSGVDKDIIIQRIPMMGCDIERIEEDHVDIEFFPNRPDLYSTEGVARAIRGFLDIETGLRKFSLTPSDISITKDREIEKIRPYLACAVIRGIRFNSRSIESLMSLQESLHWAVGRNRKKVSIGVHDLGRIKPPFRYIAQDPGFKFIPLDFTEPMTMREILEKHPKGVKFAYILEKFDKYPLILDAEDNILSFPPIINGELTRVTEDTKDLFIEATGLDPSVSVALNIVVTALAERGGRIESVTIDGRMQTPGLEPGIMELKISEVEELLGIRLEDKELIHCLERMRYGAIISGSNIEVSVPAYRSDILHTWDLVEDIAIGYGFDRIRPEFPSTSTIGNAHPISRLKEAIREIMVGLGYSEVMPFTLTSERIQFDMMRRERIKNVTHILYPISEEHTIVRPAILPNLLEILSINRHRELPQRIFEVGEVVKDCRTVQHLGAVAIHPQANFTEIQAVVDAVMRERSIEYEVAESSDPAFIEDRRADIMIRGERAGVFGELHPEVISNSGLEHPIIGFEIEL
ncbi:phenylalanyl-tRNA synthetase beta subunit [Candidatus Methanoperedens nitroreducens]|uniref:Phenylalanine--tRNA ligase beta subunit n=1 Tax=Candidatus Methanoperedens nitratireducens TaxID=1392998 RepID=A0A062V8J5_9EURY|nr:phenylalanine--tRNA ligase subunit beta [Candidatus Methanoperedens nitroreducens]KCZ72079.1 phenylalanyl-tRNA synthetase beta subunit [Candidatus Methanoperedens nitroreducens]MDJ1421946.1 phenylalanine--tRNA ligase subunit beta [Candidatus Methanoperedens sp.]